MAYATVQEFVDVVTVAEATALARATPPAVGYDATLIQRVLDSATAELDTYFAAKYPTPLEPVPPMAKEAAIAIAREALDRQGRDFVKAAAARFRTWAQHVAKGLAVIGGGVTGEDKPAETPGAGIQHSAPERVFTDESLAGFTRSV